MPNLIHSTLKRDNPVHQTTWHVLLGAGVMFLILQFGVTSLLFMMDLTWSALIGTALMLVFTLAFERFFFARLPLEALRALGWVSSAPRAVHVAILLSLIMLAFFPAVSLIWGVPMKLQDHWLWILLGIIVLNGIGEETLFRGFVFGHLRRLGLSFIHAGLIALVIFTAIHLLLFVRNPFVVALAGTLIALVASFPLAFLFERAGFSIWPTVILHVTTHTIRLIEIPELYAMSVLVGWLGLQMILPFMILVFRGNLLRERP